MEPGIMLYIDCEVGLEEQIQTLAEAGIKKTFINNKCPDMGRIMELMKQYGIVCEFFHSHFKMTADGETIVIDDLCQPEKKGEQMLEQLKRDVLACVTYRVPTLVVHIPHNETALEENACCKRRYQELYAFAEQNGVTLAFENMHHTENLDYIFSLLPEAKFCWDCGHQYCRTPEAEPMEQYGRKVAALHIHDNHMQADEHLIPFEGLIDFHKVAHALAESGYDGALMLEIKYRGEYARTMSYQEYTAKAVGAARQIIDLVEQYRQAAS